MGPGRTLHAGTTDDAAAPHIALVRSTVSMAMTRPVYLVDFAAYKPPEELRVSKSYAEEHAKGWPMYSPASVKGGGVGA